MDLDINITAGQAHALVEFIGEAHKLASTHQFEMNDYGLAVAHHKHHTNIHNIPYVTFRDAFLSLRKVPSSVHTTAISKWNSLLAA